MVVNLLPIPKTHVDHVGLNSLYGPVLLVPVAGDHRMRPVMSEEPEEWCRENLQGGWRFKQPYVKYGPGLPLPSHIHIEFEHVNDAIFFALRWI